VTKTEAGLKDDPQANRLPADETPHYHGHRERLRDRFRKGGAEALADYELLELILFRAMPRRDVKPLAKALIARFGSFAEVVSARPERLGEIEGLGEAAIVEIRIIEAAARRLAKSSIEKRPSMSSFAAVVDYCRTAMAFLDHEEFRILFLDKKNFLIADEVQGSAPSTMRRSTRAKSCVARSNLARPRSSSCTIIRRAIRSPRLRTSTSPIRSSPSASH
jgi:DNA repair protein RadC